MARILVMDDSLAIRMQLEKVLSEEGHDVVLATNGSDAMHKYIQQPADVCILDLNCRGGLGGVAALRLLKAADNDVKAIAYSGESRETLENVASYESFVAVVEKKEDTGPLIDEIRTLLHYGK